MTSPLTYKVVEIAGAFQVVKIVPRSEGLDGVGKPYATQAEALHCCAYLNEQEEGSYRRRNETMEDTKGGNK